MFARAKYKKPARNKDGEAPHDCTPQAHGRAASVPSLPGFRGSGSGQCVNTHQTQQATPTTYPLPLHHPSGIAYPPWPTAPVTPYLPPLPIRPNVRGPTHWVAEAPLPAVSSGDLPKGLDGEQRCLDRLPDLICSKLDSVLSSIDGETFSGNEEEFDIYEPPQLRGGWGSATREVSRSADKAVSKAVVRSNVFKKANLYANSRLPSNLPDLKLYLPSYPLICLAAQYSQRVYTKVTGKEKAAFVDSNWWMGTKAMVMKSVPIDDISTIVFAIRGSQTFMDWAVNLKTAPASPEGFLNDAGNLCHAGFLHVARKMVPSVAARLRSLLEEDPSRSCCSLLLTGHSAGGAVATLLYAHMLCEELQSELNVLTGCFKRIHCITFGTPPISLLPLQKPYEPRLKKSLFLSFINEGDPVPRADKAYIRSLLDLYSRPPPPLLPSPPAFVPTTTTPNPTENTTICTIGKIVAGQRPLFNRRGSAPATFPSPSFSTAIIPPTSFPPKPKSPFPPPQRQSPYIWEVPPGTLSNAGRLVILRTSSGSTKEEEQDDVRAQVASDGDLRGVVYGDPVCHMMRLYARRVEVLATRAVTAGVGMGGWG